MGARGPAVEATGAGERPGDGGPHEPWHRRRSPALLVTLLVFGGGMFYVIAWPGLPTGPFIIWRAPGDLWGTYLAAVALAHGHWSTIYVAMPGTVLGLAPVGALGSALNLEVGPNFAAFSAPTGWLLLGPIELLVGCLPLFAVDRLLERWGAGLGRRYLTATVEGLLVSLVLVAWGHPEDAVAIGVVLYAVVALLDERWTRAGWLLGIAIAIQPFSILAVPALGTFAYRAGLARDRRTPGFIVGIVAPYALLLAPALLSDRAQAVRWLAEQPNYPQYDHQTLFTSLATKIPHSLGGVSAGPMRMVGISVAALVSVLVCWRARGRIDVALWAVALSFTLWLASESVVDTYYVWPTLALAVLVAARHGRWTAVAVDALAVGSFVVVQQHLPGRLTWWLVALALLAALLALSAPPRLLAPFGLDPGVGNERRAAPVGAGLDVGDEAGPIVSSA